MVDWDADSALIHGITRAQLAVDGVSAAEAARRLYVDLGGCDVHSNAPAADAVWLGVLMRAAGLPPLRLRHHYDALRPIFRPLVEQLPLAAASSLAQALVARAEARIDRKPGLRHRAEPDARRLYDTWLLVREMVDAELNSA